METKPFTKSDYMAFAGVESAAPEISHHDFGTFILDGAVIQVFVETHDYQDYYQLTAPSPLAAKAIASALPEVLSGELLKAFGFDFISPAQF